jgi:cytoskeletal protein CcmA (bactofilin family)
MFKKKDETPSQPEEELSAPAARVTSVLGSGIAWHGAIRGKGGVRVEGAFEGDITLDGMLVVGETGRVTCEHVHAETVIVAGALRGDVTAKKVEIRKSGRVWGDVITESFSTEEGAFLRGQIQMEESVDLGLGTDTDAQPEEEQESEED